MENSANTQVTNTETQENNKLIAEFMGYSFKPLPDSDKECYELSKSWDIIHVTDFQIGCFAYHSDWLSLKTVVEEIRNKTNYDTNELFNYAFWNNVGTLENTNEYREVVNVIKQYNANK